ncbi:hypothetical protein RI367_000870 [Sorochytrium milnesiophthora]
MHAKLAAYVVASLLSLALLVVAAVSHGEDGSLLFSTSLSLAAVLLATALSHAEHVKRGVGSMLLTGFWLVKTVSLATTLYTSIDDSLSSADPVFVLTALATTVSAALLLVEGFWQTEAGSSENAETCAAPFARATFMWMTPLMQLGRQRALTLADTYELSPKLRSKRVYELFLAAKDSHHNSQLLPIRSLLWQLRTEVIISVLAQVGAIVFAFTQPLLVNGLLAFIQSYSMPAPQPAQHGYLLAVGVLVAGLLEGIFAQQQIHYSVIIRTRLQTTLMNAVHQKALRLSLAGQRNASVGEVVNHMSVDTFGFVDVVDVANSTWSCLVIVVVALAQLWQYLGYAALCGCAVFLVLAPVLGWAGRATSALHQAKMVYMDDRIKLVSEVISGMRSIKLFATESHYIQRINEYRDKEQGLLRKMQTGLSAVFGVTDGLSTVIAAVSFGVYVATAKSDAPLDSTRVFTSLLYFKLLDMPLNSVLHIFARGTRSLVSYRRLASFLGSPEIEPDAVVYSPDAAGNLTAARVIDGSFSWQRDPSEESVAKSSVQAEPNEAEDASPFSLTNINVDFAQGKLTAIVGRVGQGKTSLLHALLGEMVKQHGRVEVNGRVAYVAQQAWIVNGTLRENILMGAPMDEHLYRRTLYACSLVPDLKVLEQGDMTPIGDKGINLSGGQKARVSLARAVYSRADIYLLDDCLSAVDAHVDKHIFRHVIGSCGMLSGKTVIMVTHGVHHLPQCDRVVFLRDGTITEQGTFDAVMSSNGDVQALVTEYLVKKQSVSEADSASVDDLVPASSSELDLGEGADLDPFTDFPLDASAEALVRADDDNITGTISWDVYKSYTLAMGKGNMLVCALLMLGYAGALAGAQLWLAHVATATDRHEPVPLGVAVGVYFAFTAGMILFRGVGNYWILVQLCLRACKVLHSRLLKRIFRARSAWLDETPAGRIINRFSGDVNSLDDSLCWTMLNVITLSVNVVASVIVIAAPLPWMIIPLAVALCALLYIQRFYLASSRELKRLDSGSKAPVFQLFAESIGGLATVRAYKYEAQITGQIESTIDSHMRAQYANYASSRWLGVIVNVVGTLVSFGVAIIPVAMRHTATGAQVGLGFVGAQSLVNFMMWVIQYLCEAESSITSVERIVEYSKAPIEAAEHDAAIEPSWPSAGSIRFLDYSCGYQSLATDEPAKPVLQNLHLTIRGGEKIGICGRTGAGKSTITLSLFRILEALSGKIEIDGQDISKVGLADLRSRLTIIPQDPMLFQGTIRDNLDPLSKHDDAAVWRALELASLKEYIAAQQDGLEAKVENGGSNFSAGQKQLLTLATALLRKQRIVIFDEATSATDAETDVIVQRTIRSEFRDCTVLTIAHRIATIMDSDRILVLDQGRVAEFDTPQVLLQNPESAFAKLVESARTH